MLGVEVIGARIRIWVNDTPYVDWIDREKTYTQGHIAIQAHHPGSHVQIRKLEIMELDESGKPIEAAPGSEGVEVRRKGVGAANREPSKPEDGARRSPRLPIDQSRRSREV